MEMTPGTIITLRKTSEYLTQLIFECGTRMKVHIDDQKEGRVLLINREAKTYKEAYCAAWVSKGELIGDEKPIRVKEKMR